MTTFLRYRKGFLVTFVKDKEKNIQKDKKEKSEPNKH